MYVPQKINVILPLDIEFFKHPSESYMKPAAPDQNTRRTLKITLYERKLVVDELYVTYYARHANVLQPLTNKTPVRIDPRLDFCFTKP
jgi:hypothetical protein